MKNTQKWGTLLLSIIIIIGLILRLFHFADRAPFDWDQDRDYRIVSQIVTGKFTLLGPEAKGVGGFYLAPLYYYLLVPGYVISQGNPLSFPVTSIVLDVLALSVIVIILVRRQSVLLAIWVATIWALSWAGIEWSLISWNAVMIPGWSLLLLLLLTSRDSFRNRPLYPFAVGVLAGLAWHIHASLIIIGPLMILANFYKFKLNFTHLLALVFGYLLSYSPILIFDIRHAWFNLHLMLNYIDQNMVATTSYDQAFWDVLGKLGKSVLAFFGAPYANRPYLGVAIVGLAVISLFRKNMLAVQASLFIIFNIVLATMLRDLNFPEYYLAGSYLPIILIIGSTLPFIRFKNIPLLLIIVGFFVIYQNQKMYRYVPTPYAISHKVALVEAIKKLDKPVDVRYELAHGREGGIAQLLRLNNIVLDSTASTKVLITDKTDASLLIGGELAPDLYRTGAFRVATHELQ